MSKTVKGMVIDDVARRVGDVRDMLVIDVSQMDAFSANLWRLDLRKKNITAITVRNTLARKALERGGVAGLDDVLVGPSTLVFGGRDVVELSKEIVDAAKKNDKIQIKGGAVEGGTLDAAGVESLSKSPSREDLLAKIVSQVLAPGANLAAALLGPGSTVASQLKTIHEREGGDTGAASAESA